MDMKAELIHKIATIFLKTYIGMWVIGLCLIVLQLLRRSNQHRTQQRQLSTKSTLKVEHKKLPKAVQPPQLKCQRCDGHYIFKRGKNGFFVGCSNCKSKGCHSTLSVEEFLRRFLCEFGVKIYSWEIQCHNCSERIKFYTYDLVYDLRGSIWDFIPHNLIIGSIPALDFVLSQKYPISHIYETYENICEYCHADNYYKLPIATCEAFSESRAEENFWVDTIKIYDKGTIEAITDAIIKLYEEWEK